MVVFADKREKLDDVLQFGHSASISQQTATALLLRRQRIAGTLKHGKQPLKSPRKRAKFIIIDETFLRAINTHGKAANLIDHESNFVDGKSVYHFRLLPVLHRHHHQFQKRNERFHLGRLLLCLDSKAMRESKPSRKARLSAFG